MNNIAITFAKLAGLYKIVLPIHTASKAHYQRTGPGFRPVSKTVLEYFKKYEILRDELIALLPDLFSDLEIRELPKVSTEGKVSGQDFALLIRDLEYIFEVRANSETNREDVLEKPQRVFISHGHSRDWLEVQAYIEKVIELDTLELAQEANRGRTVLQKLSEESDKCSFAVVVMTGDDNVDSDAPRVRENVMHEIGFFQGKYGLANVCLLHEEGVNIPTNIHGVVYIPFPKGLVGAAFGLMNRELKAAF